MGNFTDAVNGQPQNITQQNQLANTFNGSVTATDTVRPYGSTVVVPLVGAVSSAVNCTIIGGNLVGDTGWRFTLGVLGAGGQGTLVHRTSSGTGLGNWYYGGPTTVQTDNTLTVQSAATLDGTVTIPGLTSNSTSNVTGTFACNGTVQGLSSVGLANNGVFNTTTAGASLALGDDGTNLNWNNNAPAGAARNFAFYSVDAAGATHLCLTAKSDGTSLIANTLHPVTGGSISRISTNAVGLPFTSCSPSCYGTATISHNLGTTPTAATTQCGDGGSGSTNTFLQGFDQLGSSTLRLWCTEGGGTNYVRVICYAS